MLSGSDGSASRRTANVRSHGYTSLFVLYKEDLNEALQDYPEDKWLLGRKAAKAALENAPKQENGKPLFRDENDVIFPIRTTRYSDSQLVNCTRNYGDQYKLSPW